EFIGKGDLVSDLCGEKLHEAHVRRIIEKLLSDFQLQPTFAMMAPEWGQPPAYVLFLEAPLSSSRILENLASRLEAELLENHQYAYCRRLGQLGPARAARATSRASELYLERCASLGQRPGSIKPTALHAKSGWSEWFGVANLEAIHREAG
ncbi:MAG TPA: GH3 auxin-responsive promoter family protein, partial [Candidatus Binatia bacterium]